MKSLLTTPPDAFAALYFLPGQYLFKRNENGREITKALSGEQIARAFRDFQTDTGWLTARRVLRWREEPDGNYFYLTNLPEERLFSSGTSRAKREKSRCRCRR